MQRAAARTYCPLDGLLFWNGTLSPHTAGARRILRGLSTDATNDNSARYRKEPRSFHRPVPPKIDHCMLYIGTYYIVKPLQRRKHEAPATIALDIFTPTIPRLAGILVSCGGICGGCPRAKTVPGRLSLHPGVSAGNLAARPTVAAPAGTLRFRVQGLVDTAWLDVRILVLAF